jgi:hypothetical protein
LDKGLKLHGKEMNAFVVYSEAEHESPQVNFNGCFGTLYIDKFCSPRLVEGSGGSQLIWRASQ